ncbi:MAG: DUF3108 domain-containing protein [Candidatus Omnitrophica bacterium]|nr:DUF3108 domain-containing protein [Candidatus Omnitrophota bacterium]
MKKTASKIIIAIICVIVLFSFKETSGNSPISIIRRNDLQNRLTAKGDIFTFRVALFGLVPVGEAKFENEGEEVYQNRKVYHLSAAANLLDFYTKFFKAGAQIDSYVDKDKLHTLKFKQTLIRPNKPVDEKEVLYDQDKNFMELRGVKRQILPDTQDPLSAIFYIQHQNLELGKVFDLNINTNQKNYQLYLKVADRKEYALESKKIGVWVLTGVIKRRDKNNPYHKTTMKIWIMDSPSKIPILVKTMTSGGQITARLESVD